MQCVVCSTIIDKKYPYPKKLIVYYTLMMDGEHHCCSMCMNTLYGVSTGDRLKMNTLWTTHFYLQGTQ